jgi:putative protease
LKNGDKVFITTDAKLNERLQNTPLRLKKVVVSGEFLCGNKAKIELNGIAFESDFNIDVASNRPTERTDIEKCFNKKDIYPFEIVYKDIVIDNNAFVPVSLLNEFRRKAYSEYFERLTKVNKVEKFDLNLAKKCSESAENGVGTNKKSLDFSKKSGDFNKKIAVIATKLSGLKADIGILKLDDYHADGDKINELIGNFIGEKFLFLPAYLKGVEIERVKQIIGDFDGIYCDNTYAIELSKELGKKLFAGVGFNLSNSVAMGELKADYIALSKELTTREVKPLLSENTFYLTAGDIKVMDLIYCPFGRTCGKCDKKTCYELTDENGRKFPLKRYKVDDFCRFEIYNCASLVAQNNFTGALIDCTIEKDVQKIIDNYNDEKGLKEIFKNYTRGHSDIPVL